MSYERSKIISLIYRIFEAEHYKWFDITEDYPSYQEIENFIEKLENAAEKENIVESGRIRVEYDKQFKTFTYYLDLGTC